MAPFSDEYLYGEIANKVCYLICKLSPVELWVNNQYSIGSIIDYREICLSTKYDCEQKFFSVRS